MKRAFIFLLSLTVLVSLGVIKCSNDGKNMPPSTTSSPAGEQKDVALASPQDVR